jgi:NhaA family Na+:H+ antiporter
MFIPISSKKSPQESPLKDLEYDLHSLVAFAILPIFAFANAGINLSGVGFTQLSHGVPLGIALGLVVGKQVGIFGLCWIAITLKLTNIPKGMSWMSLYGTSALCGIGFTMSLFIGSLAFEGVDKIFDERLGIILGSLISGTIGYIILRLSLSDKGKRPLI